MFKNEAYFVLFLESLLFHFLSLLDSITNCFVIFQFALDACMLFSCATIIKYNVVKKETLTYFKYFQEQQQLESNELLFV